MGTVAKWLIVFVAGAAFGYLAAVYFPGDRPPTAMEAADLPAMTPGPNAPVALPDHAVDVLMHSARGARISSGLLFDETRAMIVPLADLAGVSRIEWRDREGLQREIVSVREIAPDLGLAALVSGAERHESLALASGDGSLFLGREFKSLAVDGLGDGWVDSALTQDADGRYSYELALSGATPGLIALLDPGTDQVIGISLPATGTDKRTAFDTTTLGDLLATGAAPRFASLADFREHFAASAAGQLQRLGELIERRRWADAVELSLALVVTSPGIDLGRYGAIDAFAQHANALTNAGRASDALAVIDEALALFGTTRVLDYARAQALASLDRLPEAIAALRTGGSANDADRSLVRQWVLAAASDSALARSDAIALLHEALVHDDYAPFHRQLGILYFESGDYVQARRSLARAVELEPAFASDLDSLLARARQRATTPALTEVPLIRSGSALFVDVRLNGSNQSFRFLLDTGASFTAVSTGTILRLGLNDIFSRGAPVIELESAGGPIYAQQFLLGSVDLGGASVANVPVVILEELNGADGLLGLSYLSHFNVDIDLAGGKLVLSRR